MWNRILTFVMMALGAAVLLSLGLSHARAAACEAGFVCFGTCSQHTACGPGCVCVGASTGQGQCVSQ